MDPVRKGLRAARAALRVVHDQPADPSLIDSRAAAWRLAIALIAATLGNAPMYVLAVALPAVQSDFGIGRGEAALAYTAMMVGLGAGGYLCGRWADRFGVWRVLALGGVGTLAGFGLAASAPGLAVFVIAHCVLLGFLGIGSSYGPLMADTALWWQKRRGVAVAVVASGNFLAGTIWPPIVQAGIEAIGWRGTFWALGVVCGLGIVLLSLFIRERPPKIVVPPPSPEARASGITPIARSGCLSTQRSGCSSLRPWDAAWRWPCRRCISWRTALTWVLVRRVAQRCCHSCWAAAC
jgi:MFS family permease